MSVPPRVPFLDLESLHAGLEDELLDAMRRTVRRNLLIQGPECAAFEDEFAAYCGASHGIGVGNGLDALSLGLRALGVGAGDEVVVPGQTFIATWLAVSAVGAVPVPADVDALTGQIDVERVAAAITARTTAIVVVHLFGAPAPIRELRQLADKRGLALVEDAAQAHGAQIDGRRVGSFGDVAAFSFYPGKNLGALGDGGMAVTNRADVAERLRTMANYGSRVKYDHVVQGVNSRLDELQAAVLRVKLSRLDAWNAHRGVIADRYRTALADLPGLVMPAPERDAKSVHHLFPVRLRDRDRISQRLRASGVEVGIHYPVPPHLSGAYAGKVIAADLLNSQRWAAEELSLPIGPTMSIADADFVAKSLRSALEAADIAA